MIHINDIISCHAEGNYTKIHLVSGKDLLASKSLKHYQNLLDGLGFFRIHRSILLNIKYIQTINESTIKLKSGQVLQISKRNKKGLILLMRLLS